ncbi:MAG: VIT family protein [Pseudomonadales bacterium]
MTHTEQHRSHRIGWLRAAVLGANDGIISTSSLIIGIAAANTTQNEILLVGLAGLVAGAMSMAAGEYVSVSSQADAENADLAIEKKSLQENFAAEKEELANIYEARGLTPDLAIQVAEQLMKHDALGAHARDDIGITDGGRARPVQAALWSAVSFATGSLLPLSVAWWGQLQNLILQVAALSLIFLAILGGISARIGGASVVKASIRITFWGCLAMMLTALVGQLFGVAV